MMSSSSLLYPVPKASRSYPSRGRADPQSAPSLRVCRAAHRRGHSRFGSTRTLGAGNEHDESGCQDGESWDVEAVHGPYPIIHRDSHPVRARVPEQPEFPVRVVLQSRCIKPAAGSTGLRYICAWIGSGPRSQVRGCGCEGTPFHQPVPVGERALGLHVHGRQTRHGIVFVYTACRVRRGRDPPYPHPPSLRGLAPLRFSLPSRPPRALDLAW